MGPDHGSDVLESRRSHIQLGASTWKAERQHASDYREAFREHSQKEVKDVRGAMADDVRRDLRAVHWQHGFGSSYWESEAASRSRSVGALGVPAKVSGNSNRTQFKLGNFCTEYVSDARDGLRNYSKVELDAAKGALSECARKDLRAVHIFAPRGTSAWSSDAMNIGKGAEHCAAPSRHTKDMRRSHIYFGAEQMGNTSDAKEALRPFSSHDMSIARGTMADEVKRDLRAVHFIFGTDKGILDRSISERYPHRRRPQSATR